MKRWLSLLLIAVGLIVLTARRSVAAPPPDPADEDGYIINFNRRETRARKATIELVCAQLTTQRRSWDSGKPYIDQEPLGYRMLADVETGAPDSSGRPTTITYKIRTFTETKGSAERELLGPGATVSTGSARGASTRSASGGITVDGKKPSDQIRRALSFILSRGSDDGGDDSAGDRGDGGGFQDLFGSRFIRRRPGETWKVDRRAVVDTYASRGFVIDPDDVNGHATFHGVETIAGVRSLKVETVLDVDRFVYGPLPAGTQPTSQRSRRRPATAPRAAADASMGGWDSGALSWRMTWNIPLDPDAIPPRGTTSSTLTYRMHGEKDGFGYSNEHSVQREYDYRLVPPEELADLPPPTSAPATRPASQPTGKTGED